MWNEMNEDGISVCVHVLVSPAINHCVFTDGSMCMHVSVKNGLKENKLSGCFKGQLYKALACLHIWGFGGEKGEVEKSKELREWKKKKHSQERKIDPH